MEDLFTERLILNKIEKSDVIDFYSICGSEEITTTFMMEQASNMEEARSFIEAIENKYQDKNFLFWAIRLKENNKLIGILLSYETNISELGYAIAKDYQNKGYATEALKAVTDFLALSNVKEILLGTYSDNYASIKVMQKCGYTFYEFKENEFFFKGKARDIVYYIKKEY